MPSFKKIKHNENVANFHTSTVWNYPREVDDDFFISKWKRVGNKMINPIHLNVNFLYPFGIELNRSQKWIFFNSFGTAKVRCVRENKEI